MSISSQSDADAEEGVRSTDAGRARTPRQGEPERVAAPRFLTVCAWCEQVRLGRRWLPMEEVVRRLDLFGLPGPPNLTHGICPTCLEPLIARGTAHETPPQENRAA